jgi:thymidylate kinase
VTAPARDRTAAGPATGFTVALIGPDGAGKTTVARRLEHELGLPVRYLYMGVSTDSANSLLPTSRIAKRVKRARGAPPDTAGPPPPPSRPPSAGGGTSLRRSVRAGLRLANRLAEEWWRQGLAWRATRRGEVVVFDRHFFSDYYAYDVTGTDVPLSRRIHGFLLTHAYPQPDLVVYLDAPPEVLLARKGEGTIEALARRRQDYLDLVAVIPRFEVVDASRSLEEVTDEVTALIRSVAAAR